MLFRQALLTVEGYLKYCPFKNIVLPVFRGGQLSWTNSIHSLPLRNDLLDVSKRSALCFSLEITRHASRRKGKRVDPPVDYLPFTWERKKKFDEIEGSGDKIRSLEVVDVNLSKHDLELTEALEDVDDMARKEFTLVTASKSELFQINKQLMLKKVQQHPMDFDSWEVKIALLTLKIRSFVHHLKTCPKDKRGKVRMIHTIHKRNKMLKMLRSIDMPRFEWLVKELDLEYTPSPLQVTKVRYTRKNELRRLTKEYCENLIKEKRDAYHAELKEQQKLFLKEKEEILAWIAQEERELGITTNDVSVS